MHSKKEKGDIGLTRILADMTLSGFHVSIPISEHLKYDLIAERNGVPCRVQARYSSLGNNGRISIKLGSSWSNSKGAHSVKRQRGDYDLLACYCPQTDKSYYLSDQEINTGKTITLIHSRDPGTSSRVRFASDYQDCKRAFESWLGDRDRLVCGTGYNKLTKSDIESLKKEMTWDEIGDLYDCSGVAVRRFAENIGVDLARSRFSRNKIKINLDEGDGRLIADLIKSGKSLRSIADETGHTRYHVSKVFRQMRRGAGARSNGPDC